MPPKTTEKRENCLLKFGAFYDIVETDKNDPPVARKYTFLQLFCAFAAYFPKSLKTSGVSPSSARPPAVFAKIPPFLQHPFATKKRPLTRFLVNGLKI
jgi:hypothetical protein